MKIIREYIGEIISFVRDKQDMDLMDYMVYIGVLLSMTLYIRSRQTQFCIRDINLFLIIRLVKIMVLLLVGSTLIFSLYRLIRKKQNKKTP